MTEAKYGSKRTEHGLTDTGIYRVWTSMRQRCFNPAHKQYDRYGGRGITVSKRWLNFLNFVEDMGFPEEGQTLDRIDNNGNYSKKNCRWASRKTQSNNREVCVNLTFKGKTQTITQWAEELGVNRQTLGERIKRGWTTEKVLSWKYTESLPYFAHYQKINGKGRNVLFFTFKGKTKSFREWAEIRDLHWKVVFSRYSKGWDIEDILRPL